MMSGSTSNISGVSTGSSSGRPRSRIVRVPKRYWCGEDILGLISKSDNNPYRRYFRCGYAASKKLSNDNHIFKWVDEALSNEIEALQLKNAQLEKELKEIATERLEFEKNVYEKIQMKIEKDVLETVKDVLADAKCSMKKMMVAAVIGCMIIVGGMKLLG